MEWRGDRVNRAGNSNVAGTCLKKNEKFKTILKHGKIYYIENGGQLLFIPNETHLRKLA